MSGLQIAVVEGGPRLGDLESGTVASLVSAEFSIVSGGLACVAGAALLAAALPGFRHYRMAGHAAPLDAAPLEQTVPPGTCPGGTG